MDFAPPEAPARPHADLTLAERRVLELMSEGLFAREAAELLSVQESTVRTHIRHLHRKCDTRNLAGLATWRSGHRACCVLSVEGQLGLDADPPARVA